MTLLLANRIVRGMRGALDAQAQLRVFDHQGQRELDQKVRLRVSGSSDIVSQESRGIELPKRGGRIQILWRLRMDFSIPYQVGDQVRTAFLHGSRSSEWVFAVHPIPANGGTQRIIYRSGGGGGVNVSSSSIMSLRRNESAYEIQPRGSYSRLTSEFTMDIVMSNSQQSSQEEAGEFNVGIESHGGSAGSQVSGGRNWGGSWQTGGSFGTRVRMSQPFTQSERF